MAGNLAGRGAGPGREETYGAARRAESAKDRAHR